MENQQIIAQAEVAVQNANQQAQHSMSLQAQTAQDADRGVGLTRFLYVGCPTSLGPLWTPLLFKPIDKAAHNVLWLKVAEGTKGYPRAGR